MFIALTSLISLLVALYLCQRKARNKWRWGLCAALFPFPTLWILVQLDRSGTPVEKPSIGSWGGRIVLVTLLFAGLVFIEGSPLVNNTATYAIKAKVIGIISPEVLSVDRSILRTSTRSFEVTSFAKAGFALAGLGALYGLCAFRKPFLIVLSQSVLGFSVGFLADVIRQVYIIEMVLRGISINVKQFNKSGFMIDVCILMTMSLIIHWLMAQKNNSRHLSEPAALEPGDRFKKEGKESLF